jgi:hypothetical protein
MRASISCAQALVNGAGAPNELPRNKPNAVIRAKAQ